MPAAFMGTLENWDPAVTDPLAAAREVILFNNAGVGRSAGKVPATVAGMATHALKFLDGLGVATCDVLGFSPGGMVAQQIARDRPVSVRRMILVGTAPRGGEDIMRLEKPTLARHLAEPTLKGYGVLQEICFTPTPWSQAAGRRFIERLAQRKRTSTRPQDRTSPRHRLRHSVSGSNLRGLASAISKTFISPRSSSMASTTK